MPNGFIRILSLAQLIFIGGIRRQALAGLILFALTAEICSLSFFNFIPRDIGRASNDFLFSISGITGFIFILFHAVQVAAWDEGHRVIHTYLARPLSRTEYVLGVFIGLALLLLILNLILGGIAWIILTVIKNDVKPIYFQHLSFAFFWLSTLGLYCIELMILGAVLLFSGAVRGSFPVLLLTLSYYLTCYGLPVVREATRNQAGVNLNQEPAVFLKWMTAIFPDFSWLDFKMLVTATEPPPIVDIIPIFGLSAIYVVIMLWFASLLYQRRDLM